MSFTGFELLCGKITIMMSWEVIIFSPWPQRWHLLLKVYIKLGGHEAIKTWASACYRGLNDEMVWVWLSYLSLVSSNFMVLHHWNVPEKLSGMDSVISSCLKPQAVIRAGNLTRQIVSFFLYCLYSFSFNIPGCVWPLCVMMQIELCYCIAVEFS